MYQEEGQERPLTRGRDHDSPTAIDDLERAKDPEVHRSVTPCLPDARGHCTHGEGPSVPFSAGGLGGPTSPTPARGAVALVGPASSTESGQ